MIRDAVNLIISGVVSRKLWIIAFIANVGTMSSFAFFDVGADADPDIGFLGLLAIGLIIGVVAIFVTSWMLTRALARTKYDEQGGVGAWIGWGVVSTTPIMLAAILLYFTFEEQPHWLIVSIILEISMCITSPFLVLAAGRAINRNGPQTRSILNYWLGRYGRLFFGYFVAAVPLTLIADAIGEFGRATPTNLVLTGLASAILYFCSSILVIAVTVVAYREAEAGRPSTAR